METDFLEWTGQQEGRQYDLHARHVNPAFVKMLRTIGFDRCYTRGEGPYLYDGDQVRALRHWQAEDSLLRPRIPRADYGFALAEWRGVLS
jgi:hypothetical protein